MITEESVLNEKLSGLNEEGVASRIVDDVVSRRDVYRVISPY